MTDEERADNNEQKKREQEEAGHQRPSSQPTYKSQDGFVLRPVRRGLTEIKAVLEELKKEVHCTKWFVCGGYARYMASPRLRPVPASDLDIYFKDEDGFAAAENLFKNTWKLTVRHQNDVSLTFRRPQSHDHPFFSAPIIQLIKPIREGRVVANGLMVEILENFDFTVIRAGYMYDQLSDEIMVDSDFDHDEQMLQLRMKNIHCPISSTLRCMKYARKGYWLDPREALKLFFDWDSRTDEYKKELIELLAMEEMKREEIDHLERLMRRD